MPFFLKPCIKMRKKKKNAVKKNSSMYFKPYYDKESPVTSEVIHEVVSNTSVLIDRDERHVGLRPKLILGCSESQTENTEAKESGNTKDITGVPSPDRDIFDILSSAVQQLSEEKSSSDDNRYSILSSSSGLDEVIDNTEMKELFNESFETLSNKMDDLQEQQFSDSFTEECVEDLIEDASETQDFMIASRISKDMLLTGICSEGPECRIEVMEMTPVEECSLDVAESVSMHHQVSEIEPLVPLTVQECYVERPVPSIASRISKAMLLTEIYREGPECRIEVMEMSPVEECSLDVVESVSMHRQVREIEPLVPLNIQEYYVERPVPSIRNESTEVNEYQYEEEVCVEFDNVLATDTITTDLVPSPEKIHWESESDISMQEVSPIIDISDKQEGKYESESNKLFHSKLSRAVSKVLCVSFRGSDRENTFDRFTGDATKESFGSGSHTEITRESSHRQADVVINPAESTNRSFGDITPELLKKEDSKTENVSLHGTVFIETSETSKMMQELESPILSECSGDHSAHITKTYEKGLTCRMAAKLMNDRPLDFQTNQINADLQTKANTEKRNKLSKRRRSRNVLLNSLNIKLSPEDLKKENNNADQHGSNETSAQNFINNSNEKNNLCDDNDLKTLEQNCDKIEREDIVGHAFLYGIKSFNRIRNYAEDDRNVPFETKIGYLDNKNVPPFTDLTVKSITPNEKLENCLNSNRNDSLSIEKASKQFESSEQMQIRVHQVIKKILGFVKREVSLLHQNKEYEPKGFKYFINELLFDYNFYKNQKNAKLLNSQKTTKASDGKTVERHETNAVEVEDKVLCTCKFRDSETELSPNKRNISFEDRESFDISSESIKSESETFLIDSENSCELEFSEKEDEERMLMATEFKSNNEEIFDDLKLSQSLDKYLALSENLKFKNKRKNSKSSFMPATKEMENKTPPDDFNSKILHASNENIICFQITTDYPTVKGSSNKLKSLSFDNINFLNGAETDKKLDSPYLSSKGSDIGINDLCTDAFTSCGDPRIKLDLTEDNIKSETILIPDSKTKPHISELNADKCTQSGQDPRKYVAIVLSPRENNTTVNCSVNMTVSGNTPTFTTRLTSPVSIQVIRKDNRKMEKYPPRTRDVGSKASVEDIMESYRQYRRHKFDVEKLERERLRNLELYDFKKREAMKPMRKHTRIIPIKPAESFEFTLGNFDNSVKATKRSAKHSTASTKHDTPKLLTAYHIRCKDAKSDGKDFNRYPSSNSNQSPDRELEIRQEGIPNNQIFHGRYDSLNSPIFGTPVRRRILSASKSIRSPKYSLKTETSPLKETRRHKASPHQIIVNSPKLYFLDESSPEYKRQNKGRSRTVENTTYFEDRHRPLNSPFSDYRERRLCTKLNSPKDLNSKFDDKFKRYARRGRNTGDLISYKRSTQWLKDAGIVGQALTAEEADRAFKSAAGVKVALNKFDYRRFLYKLTLLKKLRYSEIYERLCEAVNELA